MTESKTSENFRRVLAAIENFRNQGREKPGMVFTDNWYDSHPRLLIFDPVLNPYDKIVWLVIRAKCSPDMSLTVFPTYEEIQSALNISRGTVATSIARLRLTRWITLLHREKVRNSSGQITKDGNIYMIHGEPLSIKDTFELDANYMGFIHSSTRHRSNDIRKIARTIIRSIGHGLDVEEDILAPVHPFERRIEAWSALDGEENARFYSYYSKAYKQNEEASNNNENNNSPSRDVPVVHEVNYGEPVNYSKYVSCNNKKILNNNKPTNFSANELLTSSLVFPSSLTENQKHLVALQLEKLPGDLEPPPSPWTRWEQLLLDELEGRIVIGKKGQCNPVRNAALLMATYCKRLITNGVGLREDDKFQIDLAESVYADRTKRQLAKSSYEQTRENYIKRTLEQINKKSPPQT